MITVEVNPAQLQDVLERLSHIKNGANRAMARALNKTASKAKTQVSREIRNQVNLSAAYVRERLLGPANGMAQKATVARLQARLSAPKQGMRLDRFLASTPPTRAGRPGSPIKVKVKPAGGAKSIASGFFVPAKNSGGYLIAVRNEVLRRLGMKTKISGLGYTALHGPSLSQVFDEVKDQLSDLDSILADNLDHEMRWLLTKYPPPGDDGSAES